MTGADNPDRPFVPSPVFKKWEKEKKKRKTLNRKNTPAICISPFFTGENLRKGLAALKTEEVKPFIPVTKRKPKRTKKKGQFQ